MISFEGATTKKNWKEIKRWIKLHKIRHYRRLAKNKKLRMYSLFFTEQHDALLFKLQFSTENTAQKGIDFTRKKR